MCVEMCVEMCVDRRTGPGRVAARTATVQLLGALFTSGSAAPWRARRLRTTSASEREHEEVRRRTRVIRIFPSEASFLRIACALAADRNDAWAKRRYVSPVAIYTLPRPCPTM